MIKGAHHVLREILFGGTMALEVGSSERQNHRELGGGLSQRGRLRSRDWVGEVELERASSKKGSVAFAA